MAAALMAAAVCKKLRRFFAHFPQTKVILERIEQLYEYECAEEEPEHLMLLGDPGTGKSRLLKRILQTYPRVQHKEFTEVPVLYVQVPSNCTIKKLPSVMLKELGSPFWAKGDEEERTFQLHTLLKACKVRLIILDEINHAVDRGRSKTHESVADWIKLFSTQAGVSLVLAGIRRSRLLLHANDQFADRFREVLELEPLGVGDESQIDEFFRVMEAFEGVLDGVPHIDLKDDEMLKALAFATAGRLRNIRRLLVRSVELAAKAQRFRISRAILEQAFLEVIFKSARPDQNPFDAKFRGTPLTLPGEPFAPTARDMEE